MAHAYTSSSPCFFLPRTSSTKSVHQPCSHLQLPQYPSSCSGISLGFNSSFKNGSPLLNLQAKRNGAQEKKNVAFQVEKDDSESDDEDMAMIAKNFRKFLKYNKNKFKGNRNNSNNKPSSIKPSSSALECYECHKKGHIKRDCPESKKNNFKKDKFKRKAFSVTWDDTDSSSSENDSDSDNEQANVCFMASSDDVPLKKRGKWILDSGCSKHMTGNKEMLTNITYSNGGVVTFGDNSKGYIIDKGNVSSNGLRTASLTRKSRTNARALPIRSEQSTKGGGGLDVWLGRLAMVGFATALVVEVSTGKGLLENFGFVAPIPTLALVVTALVGVLTAIFIFQSASQN